MYVLPRWDTGDGFIRFQRFPKNMATIDLGKETMNATIGDTIEKNVLSFGRLPDTFLYILNGKPVPMTTVVKEGDEIKAVRIASGG